MKIVSSLLRKCRAHPVFITLAVTVSLVVALALGIAYGTLGPARRANVDFSAIVEDGTQDGSTGVGHPDDRRESPAKLINLIVCLRQISIVGHIYQIDINTRTIYISWLLRGCGEGFILELAPWDGTTECGYLGRAINIHVDGYVYLHQTP